MKEPENTYIIDPGHVQEMARLKGQDHAFTSAMNGLFDGIDLSTVRSILDIGCGPGGWMLEAAQQYPDIHFLGIDVSAPMIEFANVQALMLGLTNARFEVRSALSRPDLPTLHELEETFDFINVRLSAAFMMNESWVPLFEQCLHHLNPGGMIRSTEIDHFSIVGSPTLYRWLTTLSDTMRSEGRTFFTEKGQQGSVTAILHVLLQQAGFIDTSMKAYILSYGFGQEHHETMTSDARRGFKLIKPYLLKQGVTAGDLDEWEYTLEQELDSPDFQTDIYLKSVTARKSGE